jgi:hypothetical protein
MSDEQSIVREEGLRGAVPIVMVRAPLDQTADEIQKVIIDLGAQGLILQAAIKTVDAHMLVFMPTLAAQLPTVPQEDDIIYESGVLQ